MTTPEPQRLFRAIRRVIAGILLAAFVTRAVAVHFDIPSQQASSAIQVFIKQSGQEVIYPFDDLQKVTANAVSGEMKPAVALSRLLANTGFSARQSKPNQFVVAAVSSANFGTVDGEVREAQTGKPIQGAKVQIAGGQNTVSTDKRGRFALEEVAAGSQVLLIAAEGMQNTRVTDVDVRAGHRLSLGPIAVPAQQSGVVHLTPFSVSAKKK
jgi:hypothetical protein